MISNESPTSSLTVLEFEQIWLAAEFGMQRQLSVPKNLTLEEYTNYIIMERVYKFTEVHVSQEI